VTALALIVAALKGAEKAPLVEYRGRSFTGAELLGRIQARAGDLRAAGLHDGDTALIVVNDNLSAIEQLIACWWLGASGCLVDFRSAPARIAEWVARLAPGLVIGLHPVLGTGIHLQTRNPDPDSAFADPLPDNPDRIALSWSSSGSTGMPSLHARSQQVLATALRRYIAESQAEPWGTMLSPVSVAYSASCHRWLRNLAAAKPIVALDLIHGIDELDAALRREDVKECSLPPAMIRRLAAMPGDGIRYPQLDRLVSVGGPALPADKVAAVTRLSPNYTMTYSCVGIGLIARIAGADILARPTSCGRPASGVTVEIRDGDRPCLPGQTGEIVVTADQRDAARPGDLGWLDAEGYLHVAGRIQGLLCRNGVNFRAEGLAAAALALPAVEDAAVIALPDADGGDEVHLVVQGPDACAALLAESLRTALPAAERPDRIHFRDRLPLSAAGKVDLRALAQEIRTAIAAAGHAT